MYYNKIAQTFLVAENEFDSLLSFISFMRGVIIANDFIMKNIVRRVVYSYLLFMSYFVSYLSLGTYG